MTVVLIVKTQYFGSPRNRKVESHFTTTSVLIVKTQYFGSPRNRKVKNLIIEDLWTSSLIVKTQYFGSWRQHRVQKRLWKTHGGLGSLRQSTMRYEPTQPACEYGSHKQSSVAVVGTSCHTRATAFASNACTTLRY